MAKTVAEMIAQVEKENLENVAARSVADPGKLITGGTVGYLPDGTPIKNQAYTAPRTQSGPAPAPKPVSPPTPGAPSPVPAAAGTGAAATPAQIYSGIIPQGDSRLEDAYKIEEQNILDTQKPVDERTIREQTIQKFQSQIDALTNYYAEVKRQRQNAEFVQGQGRLGSDAAIQSRRGLLGSTFGGAMTNQLEDKNQQIQDSIAREIDAERSAAVQTLLRQATVEADAEIKAKTEAKRKGATEYIDFLKGAATRKEERINSAVANVLAQTEELDDASMKSLAEQLGIDLKTLQGKIETGKTTAAAEAAKAAPKPIEVDGVLYQQQDDGSYKAVTPKAAEKPLVVGGVAYERQTDGSYKAVTPKETPKPINRVVNKVLQVSLDGGVTWAPAKSASGGTTSTGKNVPSAPVKVTPVTDSKKVNAALSDIQTGIGNGEFYNENGNKIQVGADGKISPQDYLTLRNEWVKQGFSPTTFDTKMKGYRDPNNKEYAVGK